MTRRELTAALVLLLLAVAAPAGAQIVRAFTPRFTANAAGDVALAGNTLMTCSGGGQCTNARNGSGNRTNNNDFTMVYVDVDGDAGTFSSSRATLTLPSGAAVLWAGLYWGGVSAHAARGTCRLATPATGYVAVTAGQLDVSGTVYQGIADVTALVSAGGSGSYTVADVRSTPNASNVFAGWGLVVVYGLPALPARNLAVFDGFGRVASGLPITLAVSGFATPPAGTVRTRLGVLAHEGDLGYTGAACALNAVALADGRNPAANFFNSSISHLDTTVTAKSPNYVNQLGFDVDLVNADGRLANGATGATIQLTSTSDTYYPGAVSFATDLYAPVIDGDSFTKRVVDVNGGTVQPGDVLEYTLTLANAGLDDAVQTVLRDTLPAGVTYAPGSLAVTSGADAGARSDAAGDDQAEYVAAARCVVARLGAGATALTGGELAVGDSTAVRFRVSVDVPMPGGTVIANQAGVGYVGEQTGTALGGRSDGDAATPGAQPTAVTVQAVTLGGTVFEDVHYGGGAGRALAECGGSPRPGARVELYGAAGDFLAADTTDAAGAYRFAGLSAGAYTVRAVSGTVLSSRPGAATGLLPVQTFRADAASGEALPLTDRVGGEAPGLADAGANATGAPLAALASAGAVPQSVSAVTLGAAGIAGLDFGYNFDTIVNANDAGAGSLRQFLLNANALGDAGLAQAGLPPGRETSVFMVSDGLAHPGLRAGLANLLTAGTVRVALASPLPALTAAGTRVDGTTQTRNVGETNPGTLGGGGVVGAEDLALPLLPAPEVEVRDGAGLGVGFDVAAADVTLRGLAVTGFGDAAASDAHAGVRIGAGAAGARLELCALGVVATGFADPGALRSGGDHVRVLGADGGALDSCLLAFGGGAGLALTAGADGWDVTGCEFHANGRAGVSLESSGGLRLALARLSGHAGAGVDAATSTGGCRFDSLSVSRNGLAAAAGVPDAGIRLDGDGSTVSRCALEDNVGAGVLVMASSRANVITRNRIAGNGTVPGAAGVTGQIGIDLLSDEDDDAHGTAPFVTLNGKGDGDRGGNRLLNFPVLASAVLANGQVTVSGWARPGSTIELFVAALDPTGFGEGRTWLATFVEGSAADLDATSSSYTGEVNGLAQGSDNTRRFRFTLAAPPGLAAGVPLTATGMLAASGTSEFSGRVFVTTGVSLRGTAYADADHNARLDAGETGTGAALWAKLVPDGAAAAVQVAPVDAASGAYELAFVSAGTYAVVLDDGADADDLVPGRPAGWIGTEAPDGTVAGVAVAATDLGGLDFGLWHGSRVDGTVFRDDGAGGGLANDGAPAGGESGLAGARVRLLSAACADGACDSATTDATGTFRLWLPQAAAGATASVSEVNPAGWISTGGGSGSTGGSYARAADAVTFTAAAGVAYGGVTFGDVPPNAWAPPLARTILAGGVALYAHTFTAGSAGTVSLAVAETPVPALPGWAVTLYHDADGDGVLDAGETPLAGPVTLAAGQSLCVIARHASPAGAPPGAAETAALTATYAYANAVPALESQGTLSDVTTIALTNGLVLVKGVDLATVPPGGSLDYTITYLNPGPQGLSSIVIHDVTPAWTVFESAGCVTLGAGLTGCALTSQPAAGEAGDVAWTLDGTLAPGASGSVTFRVRVR